MTEFPSFFDLVCFFLWKLRRGKILGVFSLSWSGDGISSLCINGVVVFRICVFLGGILNVVIGCTAKGGL